MNVKALAQKYYPRLWDIDRLKVLVAAGKLTEADYKAVSYTHLDVYKRQREDRGTCRIWSSQPPAGGP